jgi:hypothetical protein
MNPNLSNTLLGRQWKKIIPWALILYTLFEVCLSEIGRRQLWGLCMRQQEENDIEPFAPWTQRVTTIVASCFIFSTLHSLGMIAFLMSVFGKWSVTTSISARKEPQHDQRGGPRHGGSPQEQQQQQEELMEHPRSAYAACATVSFIAGISTIISLTSGNSRICKDALGVETYLSQWAEWMVLVPMLGYITVGVEDKSSLSREDLAFILLMFLMIFFGFAMNFIAEGSSANAASYGWLMFGLSCLCYVGSCALVATYRRRTMAVLNGEESHQSRGRSDWQAERIVTKYRLSSYLLVFMPFFPLIYLLGFTRAINRYYNYHIS